MSQQPCRATKILLADFQGTRAVTLAELWGKCPHLSRVRQGRTQQALAPLNLLLIGQRMAQSWKPPTHGQQLPKPLERRKSSTGWNFRLRGGQD